MPIREENNFAFSAEETLELITPQTRLLIINSPANPTGGVTPKSEVDKLVAGLEKFPDVAIMSDEIYDHMVYDGEKHVCLLSYPSIRDRLILLNGWSKTYAMTGWRLGYAIWPGKLYDYARKLAVNLHSCVNASAQYAGLAALNGPQDEVHNMVAEFDKRRKVVVEGLNRLPGVSCATPKGAFYAFPNVKRTGWKAKALAASLLDDAGVAIIGGPDFGILGEGYVRLSYANSTENILQGARPHGRISGDAEGGVSGVAARASSRAARPHRADPCLRLPRPPRGRVLPRPNARCACRWTARRSSSRSGRGLRRALYRQRRSSASRAIRHAQSPPTVLDRSKLQCRGSACTSLRRPAPDAASLPRLRR